MRKRTGYIDPKTLEKTNNYFVKIKNIIDENEGKLSSFMQVSICNEYQQSWNNIKIANRLGYIKRVSRGIYVMPEFLTKEQVLKIIHLKHLLNKKELKLQDIKNEKDMNIEQQIKPAKRGRRKYISNRAKYLVCSNSISDPAIFTHLEDAQKFAEEYLKKSTNSDIYVAEIKERHYSKTNFYKSIY